MKVKSRALIASSIATILGIIPLIVRLIEKKPVIAMPETFFFLVEENSRGIVLKPEVWIPINIILLFTQIFLIGYTLLKKSRKTDMKSILFVLLGAMSINAFIYAYQPVPLAMISLIAILIYFFIENEYPSVLPIFLLPMSLIIGLDAFIGAFIVFLLMNLYRKNYNSIIAGIMFSALLTPTLMLLGLLRPLYNDSPLSIGLSETQVALGIPLFLFIVGITPFLIHKEKNNIEEFLIILLLGAASMIYESLILLAGFFILILGFNALIVIDRKEWKLPGLRSTSMTLIILISLFTYLSFTASIVRSAPSIDEEIVLKKTSEIAQTLGIHNGLVTMPRNNYMVEYYTSIKPLTNNEKEIIGLLLFTDYENAKRVFKEKGVRVIYIDREMKQEFWRIGDRGVKYMEKYMDIFYKIRERNGVEALLFTG